MVKTTLIYFDTPTNSGKFGTLRGFFSILIILPLLGPVIHLSKAKPGHKAWTTILLSLALCSAIGVQLSKSYKESILYAGLIGLVISIGFICITVYMDDYKDRGEKNNHYTWLSIPYLCATLILSAIFTHFVSNKLNLYRS